VSAALWPQMRGICGSARLREIRRTDQRDWWRAAVAAFGVLIALSAAKPACGQTGNLADTPSQDRPLVLSPTIRLTDLGWDDNVFRVSRGDNPAGDFTATAGPAVQATLLVPRLRVIGHSQVDFVYFKRFSEIRSIDTDNTGRVELLLGRVRPFALGEWANARHRRNFEIDLPVRRVDSSFGGGVDVYLSGKTSIGATLRRSRLEYKGDTIYLETDLARSLGATATISGLRLGYSLTPFTTLAVNVEQDRNEFALAKERNSDGFRLMSGIEFQPFALVSGHAEVGIRRRTFADGKSPQFQGTVARADLAYTLLGRTRFAVTGLRDLSYSYRADQRDFLQAGAELSVTQRIATAWDVAATLGRFSLVYGLGSLAAGNGPAEQVRNYALGIGYHIERTRIGFQVARQTRTSDFSFDRGYQQMRIGSSVSYGF
jgi:hypothetical protein